MDSTQKERTVQKTLVGASDGQSKYHTDIIQQPTKEIKNPKEKDYYTIPHDLVKSGKFCCWKYEERGGRKTKIPYNPKTGYPAESNNLETFADFRDTVRVPGYDGIGISISGGVCAIDIDDCVDKYGTITKTAQDIVKLMRSYTELSPSGRGLHILFCVSDFSYDTSKYYIMNHNAGIETYVSGATNKYVTLTGKSFTPYDYGDRTRELKIMLERYMKKPATNARNAINPPKPPEEVPDLRNTAMEIISRALVSKQGEAFAKLFDGNIEGYSSQSEADLALCKMLIFWSANDYVRSDEVFRLSRMMREKWDEQRSGVTYGYQTFAKAIESSSSFYTLGRTYTPVFEQLKPLSPIVDVLPEFPVNDLPEALRNYVNAVAENSQTSPAMAATIGIGVLSVCLQGKYLVEGHSDYTEPLSLYMLVIASPGERKSSVMRSMTGYLYDFEKEYNKKRLPMIQKSIFEKEKLERQIGTLKKKLEANETQALSEELERKERILDSMEIPSYTRFIADDCSSEALTKLMAVNGGVCSVISTEGGIFDIMGGRYTGKANFDVWLKGHCGDSIYVDRLSRKADIIPHPALSAILTVQPSVLNEIMNNTTMDGRGLLARFLYSIPQSMVGRRKFITGQISPDCAESYRSMIYRLMEKEVTDSPVKLKLSSESLERFAGYFDEQERYLNGEGQAIIEWACKYCGAVLRLAGLLHAAEMEYDYDDTISLSTLERAIRIGEYFKAHSSYAYSMMGCDISIKKAKFVMAKILSFGTHIVKRSELFQVCRGKLFQKTEELFPVLELLEKNGYIRLIEPERSGSGRPQDVRVVLNPRVEKI